MSQALFTSMTGLNTAQQAISVVSNNVANINTTAYKSADARFATLFSNTLSAGNAPSATAGGTNPKQIGLGVKLESITRNFETGSFLSTGNTRDSMISGAGYYTVMDANGGIYYTRDGSFSLDANGNMINALGYKVLGATRLKSEESSTECIHVPQNFSRSLVGDVHLANRQMNELNNATFTTGTLVLNVSKGNAATSDTIKINITQPGGGGDIELSNEMTFSAFMTNLTTAIQNKITASAANGVKLTSTINNGQVTWQIEGGTPGTTPASLEIDNSSTANTAECLSFYKVVQTAAPNPGSESKILSYTVDVNPTTSPQNITSLQSYSIGADGTISAAYDNGDRLTVYLDDSETFQYQYVTSTGVYINGTSSTDPTRPSPVNVNPLLCKPESLVLQLATVTNEAGLISQADNLWTPGPDTGKVMFTMPGQMGTGKIQAGGLEASNVDLARELSNMIIAQRAINANSRVFGTASSVLETLSQLGR